ncbi:hypothetical protein UT300007_28230 [Clostridium sp. CTA-7]
MKKYNEKLIEARKTLSRETLQKSNATMQKLTNPSEKIARVEGTIGKSLGVGLVAIGIVGVLKGRAWGIGGCVAGVTTVISNNIRMKKNK